MTTRNPALCWACTRLVRGGDTATCEAFPDGIPFDIIGLAYDHRGSHPGDHGIRFNQADTDQARAAFADWDALNLPSKVPAS